MSKDCGACSNRHSDSAPCEPIVPDLVQAVTLVSQFFNGDDQKTAFWFTTDNPNLGNSAPIDMFKRERGHKVLAWIKSALEENKV